jgi:hypothetical protein
VRHGLYDEEQDDAGSGTGSVEETIVVHTIMQSFNTRESDNNEDTNDRAIISKDSHDDDNDELSCGDSTINTSLNNDGVASCGNPQFAKGHAKSITTTSVKSVANSESSPGFAAVLVPVVPLDEKSNVRYTEDGMKLVVSFHRRGTLFPSSNPNRKSLKMIKNHLRLAAVICRTRRSLSLNLVPMRSNTAVNLLLHLQMILARRMDQLAKERRCWTITKLRRLCMVGESLCPSPDQVLWTLHSLERR